MYTINSASLYPAKKEPVGHGERGSHLSSFNFEEASGETST